MLDLQIVPTTNLQQYYLDFFHVGVVRYIKVAAVKNKYNIQKTLQFLGVEFVTSAFCGEEFICAYLANTRLNSGYFHRPH
jgi:hypothetical protein